MIETQNRVSLRVVNAFVEDGRGGNPAGVVLDADDLSPKTKQAVAARAGLSETVFVSRSDTADFKLEFFTPTRQIPHCGHATVATFALLRHLGKIAGDKSSKETIDGNRDILFTGGAAFMEQAAPSCRKITPSQKTAVLKSLGAAKAALLPGQEPMIVSTGNACLILPLRKASDLAALRPNFEAIHWLSEELDVIGYYVYAPEARTPDHQATTRDFAPRYGINEESATGTAAGPLACYLHDHAGMKRAEFAIEQGHFMRRPSPSLLRVVLGLEEGVIKSLLVGGQAAISETLELEVE